MVDHLNRFRRRPEEDEWFIPYNKPQASPSHSPASFSIGHSPSPVRQSSTNLLKTFANPTTPTPGTEPKSIKFPPLPPTPPSQRPETRQGSRRAPSYGSWEEPTLRVSLPATVSVPTGLTAPKLLFSPLSRQVRGSSIRSDQQEDYSPRSRTFSAPVRRHRPRGDPFRDGTECNRWDAPTVCDRLVLAKPNVTPHVITPPGSPDMDDVFGPSRRVLEDAERRAKEREEWARYVKRRGRSRSFSNEPPKSSAPIIGNAKVRAEEFERRSSQSRRRSSSVGSGWRHGSSRSSNDHRPSLNDRRPSLNDHRPSFLHVDSSQSTGVSKSFGFVKRPYAALTRRSSGTGSGDLSPMFGHSHAEGSDVSSPTDKAQHRVRVRSLSDLPPRRPVPGPPLRTLRIQNPPIRKQGVVIIGPEPDQPSRTLDVAKPLPDLPKSPGDEEGAIGQALLPNDSQTTIVPTAGMPNARAYLAAQHLKSRTQKAFMTFGPSNPRARLSEPITPRHVSAASISSTPSGLGRRPTALEEAIGRSRAASVSAASVSAAAEQQQHATTHILASRAPEAASPTPSSESTKPPGIMPLPVGRMDSDTSRASGKTVYTDASEGWGRSSLPTPRDDLPLPEDEMSDRFKGLFFRTPQDPSSPLSAQTDRIAPGRLLDSIGGDRTPSGLGFGLDATLNYYRRQSDASGGTSDGDTVEIATPLFSPDTAAQQSAYIRYMSESAGASSSQGRITSGHSATLSPRRASEELRLSPAPVRRPTLVATPPQAANAGRFGERRRSFVADTDYTALPSDPLASVDTPSSYQVSGDRQRYSAVPSFVHEFPSPPLTEHPAPGRDMAQPHTSAFGQVVTGPPGAGKSTYCHGMHQFLTALGRNVHVVNLDPAVTDPAYPCSISITEIITLEEVMREYELGPNGAMIYVAEYLEENIDWLIGRLDEVLEGEDAGGYVIFDTPGQVELWTNHESLRRVLERLTKIDYRLVAVHLSDSHYITDASKFIAVSLLALRAMMALELPHVNVLSKIDLLASYGELSFDLRYYAECRDLDYLLDKLESEPGIGKGRMKALNRAMVELVEEYGAVSFETLAVEEKKSMLRLLRVIDKSNGYIHLPGQKLPDEAAPELDELPGIDELPTVDDVQERWGANREVYDEEEREEWAREWELRKSRGERPAATVVPPDEEAMRARAAGHAE